MVPLWLVLPSVFDRFCLCGDSWLVLMVWCVVLGFWFSVVVVGWFGAI